jgi:hypothetical protein
MLKYFLVAYFFVLQAATGFAQDSTKIRYSFGDSLLSDSLEKVLSRKYYGHEVLFDRKFSIRGNKKDSTTIYNYTYRKYDETFEVLEVVSVMGKEQYVESYFVDNKKLIVAKMMMQTDSTGKMEQPWESKSYFLNDEPVYSWSIGTETDDDIAKQELLLYAIRRRELEKRL